MFPIKTRESVVEQVVVTRHEPKVIETEPLLTEKQACAILKTSKRNLYCWRMAGLIPYIKIGRCVRFRLNDLESTLSAKTIQHKAEP